MLNVCYCSYEETRTLTSEYELTVSLLFPPCLLSFTGDMILLISFILGIIVSVGLF